MNALRLAKWGRKQATIIVILIATAACPAATAAALPGQQMEIPIYFTN